MGWQDCNRAENENPGRAMREALEAVNEIHRAFGAPGNFGYYTKEGEALRHLYECARLLSAVLKRDHPAEHEAAKAHFQRLQEGHRFWKEGA